MRLISKNSNLRVILKPGIPAEPLTGRASFPGISVKFQDGMLEVNDQVIIDQLLAHDGCKVDFWPVEEGEWKDPFKFQRSEMEPVHQITEFEYGRPGRTISSPKAAKLPPEVEKLLNDRAIEIAKQLLPGMVEQVIKAGIAENAKTKGEVEGPKKKHWKIIEKEKKAQEQAKEDLIQKEDKEVAITGDEVGSP